MKDVDIKSDDGPLSGSHPLGKLLIAGKSFILKYKRMSFMLTFFNRFLGSE